MSEVAVADVVGQARRQEVARHLEEAKFGPKGADVVQVLVRLEVLQKRNSEHISSKRRCE